TGRPAKASPAARSAPARISRRSRAGMWFQAKSSLRPFNIRRVRGDRHTVIPGRAEGASPESITTKLSVSRGRVKTARPEFMDSGLGPAGRPGMTAALFALLRDAIEAPAEAPEVIG